MGASASISVNADPFRCTFISDNIDYAEKQFVSDAGFRKCFVDFVINKGWINRLLEYEDGSYDVDSSGVWEKFGFETPPGVEACPAETTAQANQSAKAVGSIGSSMKASFRSGGNASEASVWSLSSSWDDVRALMLVALFPLFYTSPEYKNWQFSSLSMGSSSSKEGENSKMDNEAAKKGTRLREMMEAAAAKLDATELERYLSKLTPTLIADFKKAMCNLPIRINVLVVDKAKREAVSVFESTGRARMFSLSFRGPSQSSTRDLSTEASRSTKSGNSTKGASSVAVLQATDYTPEQRQRVDELLFQSGTAPTTLRFAVTTGADQCVLRAFKPIVDPVQNTKFVVSAEGLEKVRISQVGSLGYTGRPFQQLDELVRLLPLLIKTES